MRNLTVSNTKNSFNSFIQVFENSHLKISDSHFSNNFGLAKGSVLCGDYTNTVTEIFDSVFENNSAVEGGVFCAKDRSFISCSNCSIKNNFAVLAGMFMIDTNG